MAAARWKDEPARNELLAIYDELDRLLSPLSCDASTDCCHFGRTGREPYPTAVELAELAHAVAASPLPRASKRRLPQAAREAERRCPLLTDEGRCRAYAARPFGCRTFFCERVTGGKVPRTEILALSRRIADLSARVFPRDPGPRPMTRAISAW